MVKLDQYREVSTCSMELRLFLTRRLMAISYTPLTSLYQSIVLSGAINWVRQVGSDGNDHIAPRGGLAINKQGKILVFGDTNGEFYRNRDASEETVNELFLMEFNADGSHKAHVKHSKHNESTVSSAPAPAPQIEKPQTAPPPFLIDPKNNGLSKGMVIGLSVAGGIIAAILLVIACRRGFCGQRKTNAKVATRDGIIKSPPPSSFVQNRAFDTRSDFSENLNMTEDNDII